MEGEAAIKRQTDAVRVLQVSQAELRSLKSGKAVYQRRGALFFRSSKEAAEQDISSLLKEETSKLESLRQEQQPQQPQTSAASAKPLPKDKQSLNF